MHAKLDMKKYMKKTIIFQILSAIIKNRHMKNRNNVNLLLMFCDIEYIKCFMWFSVFYRLLNVIFLFNPR